MLLKITKTEFLNLILFSDLHIDEVKDISPIQALENFFEILEYIIRKEEINLICFAGDISSEISNVLAFYSLINSLEIPVLFIPGNHDILIRLSFQGKTTTMGGMIDLGINMDMEKIDSMEKYYFLKDTATKFPYIYFLHDSPLIIQYGTGRGRNIKKIGFLGVMGMYNYRLPHLPGFSWDLLNYYRDSSEKWIQIYFRTFKKFEDLQSIANEDSKTTNEESVKHSFSDLPSPEFQAYLEKINQENKLENASKEGALDLSCDSRIAFTRLFSELLYSQWHQVSQLNLKHIVMMTHFVPFIEGIPLSYPNDYIRFLDYNSSADKWWFEAAEKLIREEIKNPLVFFGHTHKWIDKAIPLAKMLCNPIPFKDLNFSSKKGIENIAQLLRRGIKRIE